MKRLIFSILPTVALAGPAPAQTVTGVISAYADIAAATYGDSLDTAKALEASVRALSEAPSDATLLAARQAWLAARVPYMQSEVFRFGNPIVDDWEGQINSWPLDEGLIDYVDASYAGSGDENPSALLNVIANPRFGLSGVEVDASQLTPELLSGTLHEAGAVETNVAVGYHAIEFLLWGQDLNHETPGAGSRPWTDFAVGSACTGGNCDRRLAYLASAVSLLVSDLDYMAAQWQPGGAARTALLADEPAALRAMLTGMGSLSYGEVAGERMRLGLMLNDPEEEQDCFSDNTQNSHFYDAIGVQNVWLGRYVRVDGSVVEGPSLAGLVASANPELAEEMTGKLEATVQALDAIRSAVAGGMAYDMMLAAGNATGEALIMGGVDALIDQTHTIEKLPEALALDTIAFEGSDSLDNPDAIFQ